MPKFKVIPGIHIQWPWSQMILSGKKTIETRSYPLPGKYLGQPLALIETPGPRGKKERTVLKSQIVGMAVFERCYRYENKTQWAEDFDKHLVPANDSQFYFDPKKEKWAWKILSVTKFDTPVKPPVKRGITFVSNCKI